MARKTPSFKQLLRYIHKQHDPRFAFSQHILGEGIGDISAEFEQNYQYLKRKSVAFNALYHDIVSLKRLPNVPLEAYVDALFILIPEYVSRRGPGLLAYGCMHVEREHVHVHLVLSSNNLESERRKRLTKKQFQNIQRTLERTVLDYFPELQQEPVWLDLPLKNRSRKEYELKAQGRFSRKDFLKEVLIKGFAQVKTVRQLRDYLAEQGIEGKVRGKHFSLGYKGRQYRLKTLGFQEEYEQLRRRFEHSFTYPNKVNRLDFLTDFLP